MPNHDLNELRLFATVAARLSFRGAAAELGIPRATLSARIRALEASLGVRLFNRTTRSVALTEAGAALLAEAGPALETIARALAAVGTHGAEPVGRVRINGPRPAIEFRLAPLVASFLGTAPKVEIELVADDALIDVVAAGFDAGVRYGEALAQDMIAVALGRPQRFTVVGAPAYLDAVGVPSEPSDLSRHRCFAQIFPRGNRLAWTFEKEGRSESIAPVGPLSSNQPSVQLEAAESGLGLAFLFDEHCRAAIEAGRLVSVLDDWCPPFPGPFLYYPERRLMPSGLRALVDFIKART